MSVTHDVFISYPSENKVIADAICASLESHKIRCWIAPRDIMPGEKYAEALIRAIDNTKIMVLVFSSYCNNSPHIISEVQRAFDKNLIIIPFRIEDSEPSDTMKFYIGTPHWLDAMTPPLEKHLERLADTINVLLAQINKQPVQPSQSTDRKVVSVGKGTDGDFSKWVRAVSVIFGILGFLSMPVGWEFFFESGDPYVLISEILLTSITVLLFVLGIFPMQVNRFVSRWFDIRKNYLPLIVCLIVVMFIISGVEPTPSQGWWEYGQ